MRESSTMKNIFILLCFSSATIKAFTLPGAHRGCNLNKYCSVKINSPTPKNILSQRKQNESTLFQRNLKNQITLSSLSDNNESENEEKSMIKSNKAATIISLSILCLAILYFKSDVIVSLIPKIQSILSGLKDKLISSLDHLNGLGNVGLIAYSLLLLFWEVTVGMTTPVETCAGMVRGLFLYTNKCYML